MKTNQIVLLIIVFVVCGLSGYFLGKVLKNVRITSRSVVVVPIPPNPEPLISTVPVIDTIIGPEVKIGKDDFIYNLTVEASVDSKDTLVYRLFNDLTLATKIAENTDGVFNGIPAIDSKMYYLVVMNKKTTDRTEPTPIDGFEKAFKCAKVLESDLENLFNVTKSWAKSPKDMKDRVSPNLTVKVLNADPDREHREAKNIPDICSKMTSDHWLSVDVVPSSLRYDIHNRLLKLEIYVTYP